MKEPKEISVYSHGMQKESIRCEGKRGSGISFVKNVESVDAKNGDARGCLDFTDSRQRIKTMERGTGIFITLPTLPHC